MGKSSNPINPKAHIRISTTAAGRVEGYICLVSQHHELYPQIMKSKRRPKLVPVIHGIQFSRADFTRGYRGNLRFYERLPRKRPDGTGCICLWSDHRSTLAENYTKACLILVASFSWEGKGKSETLLSTVPRAQGHEVESTLWSMINDHRPSRHSRAYMYCTRLYSRQSRLEIHVLVEGWDLWALVFVGLNLNCNKQSLYNKYSLHVEV